MNIVTNGHSDRYSVEQIINLFFTSDTEMTVTSSYDGKIVETTVDYGARRETGSYPAPDSDVKALKNAVKKSAYVTLKKMFDKSTPWGILTGIRPTKFCRDLLETHSREEVRSILVNEYWVTEEKAAFCLSVCENSMKIIKTIPEDSIGLYVGVPFCPSRCAYCSFLSESGERYRSILPEYGEALKKEIRAMASLGYAGRVSSVYIGGGTPPTLGETLLGEVIDEVRRAFSVADDTEFTVEAGRPDVITDRLLSVMKDRGVNRICINPQTMNDDTLKRIGRRHTAKETVDAFHLARAHGFDNINSDLIAGLPGETPEIFGDTLRKLTLLSPEELTVHTMYRKRASVLAKKENWEEQGEGIEAMLSMAKAYAESERYNPYYMYKQRSTLGNLENTGYAKEGRESVYNVAIMEEVRTILACGAGASSKFVGSGKIERIYNIKDALSYTRDIEEILRLKEEKIRALSEK